MTSKKISLPESPLWSIPVYLPYVQPDLTPEIVQEAEQKLGVKLPRSYLDVLAVQNGGYVRPKFPGTVHSIISGIGPYFPTITEGWLEIIDDLDDDEWWPQKPHLLVPFDGDGHWYLCFDYRENGPQAEPSIAYVDTEMCRERTAATDFAEFLSRLEVETEPMLGITEDIAVADAAVALETALGAKFDPSDSWSHGYPTYRCWLSKEPSALIWLHENRVPRGFVRAEDERYLELRDRLPGTALLYPEYPDVSLVVTATDDEFERARDACIRASLPLKLMYGD